MQRTRGLVVGAICAALMISAACSTTVTGIGHAISPKASSQATSAPASPASPASSAADPVPLLRDATPSPIGDLVTANLCHGIPTSAFAQWGTARVYEWQTADACYLDIDLSTGAVLQLDTWADWNDQLFEAVGGTSHELSTSEYYYTFPATSVDCERAYLTGTVAFETHVVNTIGHVDTATRCAVADKYMRLERAAFAHHHLARRALATHSLTRYDLCALMTDGHIERIPAVGAAQPIPFLEGGGCRLETTTFTAYARIAFLDPAFPLDSTNVVMAGHPLVRYVLRSGHGCEAISTQGYIPADGGNEILDVIARPATGSGGARLCDTVERLTADMLDAAHLH